MFENVGAFSELPKHSKLECGVCWHIYDPEKGDPVWQIPPNTAFVDLPDHWCCPQCDGPKTQFIALAPERDVAHWQQRVNDFEQATRKAAKALEQEPIFNGQLTVEVVGFRPFENALVGGVITPTFINLVRLPMERISPGPSGETQRLSFPSGEYDFLSASLNGVGAFQALSLFSPVHMFQDMAAARLACSAALEALLTPPKAVETSPTKLNRRAFLGGSTD